MNSTVVLAGRAAFGALFLVAAVHKLRDVRAFRGIVRGYRVVPKSLTGTTSLCVPLAELAVVALLATPLAPAAGFAGAAALLVGYAAAIAINLARGRRHIECGCGDLRTRRPIGVAMVVRNLALAVIALAALPPVRTRPLVWSDGVIAAVAAATFGAAYRRRARRTRCASRPF